MGTVSRDESVDGVLDRIVAWAVERSDLRAVALVGSYAAETQTDESDLDLILLATRPGDYTTHDDWIAELDAGELIQTQDWGAITERRLRRLDGLEVEIGIGDLTWASTSPVDPGTRKVVSQGFRILYDPDRVLERLVNACY